MKLRVSIFAFVICLAMSPVLSLAQQQAKNPNDEQPPQLRVDIVLSEYNGDKKISALPYTIYIPSPRENHGEGRASLRMGVRVPVASGSGSTFTYMDVGTDIDCFASTLNDGSHNVQVIANRSSIYTAPKGEGEDQPIRALPDAPVVRNFNTNFRLYIRDGETKEGTSAVDPLNGHVLKISVTLHVMK